MHSIYLYLFIFKKSAISSKIYIFVLQYGERFEWNQHIQGFLVSGYFYGVLPASIPAGLLAEKYGGSRVVA